MDAMRNIWFMAGDPRKFPRPNRFTREQLKRFGVKLVPSGCETSKYWKHVFRRLWLAGVLH